MLFTLKVLFFGICEESKEEGRRILTNTFKKVSLVSFGFILVTDKQMRECAQRWT
jgi:hypothetical protein